MKLVFISNFFNHHQKSISDVFYNNLEKYFFVSTMPIPEERIKLGYSEWKEPYLISISDNNDVMSELDDADVYLCANSSSYARKILKKGNCVFYYSERINKVYSPIRIIHKFFKLRYLAKNKNLFLLSAGAYTYYDYHQLGLFKSKAYKWGYFPPTMHYDTDDLISNKDKKRILWCGRFLDWKHPDDAVEIAIRLKKDSYSFRMTFIGTGEMENQLKRLVDNNDLNDCVEFLGSMSPEHVRMYMERAGIYLFTSDRQEGWGAVLNEAMNSCCAVVASHSIGSVPYLINNDVNGLIYHSGNIDSLYSKVKCLLDKPAKQEELGRSAYKTIITEWNAEIAANRLVSIAEHILKGEDPCDLYKYGPCSKAERLKDDWFCE